MVPLKQYGAQRLPPILVTHVPGGYARGGRRIVNPPEAEAIVEQIVRCCKDPAYEGKTMGVISLQGIDQAREIERLLHRRLGPDEMQRRNLVCGDAYDFQGDERDVIFYSLVAAPSDERRIGTLASDRDVRRFNVAASRASEQIWLFHTATLDDLSPSCMRHRFLSYCLNPRVETKPPEGIAMADLRHQANSADRRRVKPPRPFDSWFEVDVFLRIVDRGYRVVPQFEVAGYYIDLVVEGIQGRLAVECNGDTWHGPDRYERDMARQRQLERSGWRFWHVWASEYYREPERAVDGLWSALSRSGIYPSSGPPDSPLTGGAGGAETGEKSSNANASPGSDEVGQACERADHAQDPPQDEAADSPPFHPGLVEYRRWPQRQLRDPRSVPLAEVAEGLVEIIAAEGPMLCHRAYRLYAEAAGIRKVGRQIRSVFNRAVSQATRSGKLRSRDEYHPGKVEEKVVWIPGTPEVLARTRGDRTLDEIPPSEITEVMRRIVAKSAEQGAMDEESLFRGVLRSYGLVRLTASARRVLEQALHMYRNGSEQGRVASAGVLPERGEDLADRRQVTLVPEGGRTSRHTPREKFYMPILRVLAELGGAAPIDEVLNRVESEMKTILTAVDFQPLPSNGEPRWRKAAQWARYDLTQKGLLRPDSPRGVWELSKLGRGTLDRLSRGG